MKRILSGTLAIGCAMSMQAQAGGLWLNEFGDPSGGRASAGAAAGVDDASTTLHNPASMSRLEDSHLMLAVGYLSPETEFDLNSSDADSVGSGDGGSAGEGTPGGAAFYVHDLDSEKWSAGVSFAALSGSGLDYDDDWVGRYQVQDVSILLIAISPSLSYQLTEKLSIGASMQLLYTELEMDVAVNNPLPSGNGPDGKAEIKGDDYDIGLHAGVLYEFTPQTRLGITYQSELESSYDSDLKVSPIGLDVDADLDIPLAQKVRLGLHHDIDDKWGLDFSAGWEDWSTFESVLIATDRVDGAINQDWDDTWHIAAGFQYHFRPDTTFTAGIAYDTSPQTDGRRTPDLPVDEQTRYAMGINHEMRDGLNVGAYINYAELGDARIKNDSYEGEYSSNSLLQISFNFAWTFDS